MTFNLDRVYMILYDQDLARTQRENPSNPHIQDGTILTQSVSVLPQQLKQNLIKQFKFNCIVMCHNICMIWMLHVGNVTIYQIKMCKPNQISKFFPPLISFFFPMIQ